MRNELLKKIKNDLKSISLNALSEQMGINQPTLYRIVNDDSRGNIITWEKISKYYKRKEASA